MFKKLPNSTRKFIRSEKARIRCQFLDYKKQEEAIKNMYSKVLNQPIIKKVESVEPIKTEKILENPQKKKTTQKPKTKSKKQKVHKNKKGKK